MTVSATTTTHATTSDRPAVHFVSGGGVVDVSTACDTVKRPTSTTPTSTTSSASTTSNATDKTDGEEEEDVPTDATCVEFLDIMKAFSESACNVSEMAQRVDSLVHQDEQLLRLLPLARQRRDHCGRHESTGTIDGGSTGPSMWPKSQAMDGDGIASTRRPSGSASSVADTTDDESSRVDADASAPVDADVDMNDVAVDLDLDLDADDDDLMLGFEMVDGVDEEADGDDDDNDDDDEEEEDDDDNHMNEDRTRGRDHPVAAASLGPVVDRRIEKEDDLQRWMELELDLDTTSDPYDAALHLPVASGPPALQRHRSAPSSISSRSTVTGTSSHSMVHALSHRVAGGWPTGARSIPTSSRLGRALGAATVFDKKSVTAALFDDDDEDEEEAKHDDALIGQSHDALLRQSLARQRALGQGRVEDSGRGLGPGPGLSSVRGRRALVDEGVDVNVDVDGEEANGGMWGMEVDSYEQDLLSSIDHAVLCDRENRFLQWDLEIEAATAAARASNAAHATTSMNHKPSPTTSVAAAATTGASSILSSTLRPSCVAPQPAGVGHGHSYSQSHSHSLPQQPPLQPPPHQSPPVSSGHTGFARGRAVVVAADGSRHKLLKSSSPRDPHQTTSFISSSMPHVAARTTSPSTVDSSAWMAAAADDDGNTLDFGTFQNRTVSHILSSCLHKRKLHHPYKDRVTLVNFNLSGSGADALEPVVATGGHTPGHHGGPTVVDGDGSGGRVGALPQSTPSDTGGHSGFLGLPADVYTAGFGHGHAHTHALAHGSSHGHTVDHMGALPPASATNSGPVAGAATSKSTSKATTTATTPKPVKLPKKVRDERKRLLALQMQDTLAELGNTFTARDLDPRLGTGGTGGGRLSGLSKMAMVKLENLPLPDFANLPQDLKDLKRKIEATEHKVEGTKHRHRKGGPCPRCQVQNQLRAAKRAYHKRAVAHRKLSPPTMGSASIATVTATPVVAAPSSTAAEAVATSLQVPPTAARPQVTPSPTAAITAATAHLAVSVASTAAVATPATTLVSSVVHTQPPPPPQPQSSPAATVTVPVAVAAPTTAFARRSCGDNALVSPFSSPPTVVGSAPSSPSSSTETTSPPLPHVTMTSA